MPYQRSKNAPFIPVLTVMVDYGNAPFLWLVVLNGNTTRVDIID